MSWQGGVVEGVAGLIGRRLNERDNRHAATVEFERQREFAQQGIGWRVADAQAAGVHPLYALGANVASYSPQQVGSSSNTAAMAQAGRGFGKAADALAETEHTRNIRQMQLEGMAASMEKDYSQSAYYDALAAKARQDGNQSSSMPSDVVVGAYQTPGGLKLEEHPLYKDAVKLSPDDVVSRDATMSGETAGRRHPSFREFELPNGDKILLPATGQGGVPEEIDLLMLPEIIGANINRFGTRQAVLGALYRWMGSRLIDDEYRGPSVKGWVR